MTTRSVLRWVRTFGLVAVVGVGLSQLQAAPVVVKKATATAVPKAPAARVRMKLGAAPKPVVTINDKPIKIDPNAAAVKSVRAIPPQKFEPGSRRKSVADFYHRQWPGEALDRHLLDKYRVGPFRSEFVWWAYRYWGVEDRAWWAWNNRAYFDEVLWAEWMNEQKFKAYINSYKMQQKSQTPGFVPAQYASTAPEIIYNDTYLEAIYNPVLAPPSIIVDGTPGPKLVNLLEDAPRTFGTQNQTIRRVGMNVQGLQFLSVPAGMKQMYRIRVKRDCDLYLFGPLKNPLQDAVGEDASKWTAQNSMITGDGIAAVYEKAVKAGDVITVQGVEWSVASEQIEVLSAASERAKSTVAVAGTKLAAMVDSSSDLFQSDPVLKPTLVVAQGAVKGMCTDQLGNVDDEQLDLFYASMASTEDSCKTIAAQSEDKKLISDANIMLSNLMAIMHSFSTFDELRDVGDQGQAVDRPDSIAVDSSVPAQPIENGVWVVNGQRHIDLLRLLDLEKDKVSGDWMLDEGFLKGTATTTIGAALEFPYAPPAEYDYILEFEVEKTKDRVCPMLVGPSRQFKWDINKGWNGLSSVDQLRPSNTGNPTYNKLAKIADAMVCKAVIQIRKDHLVCTLNGRQCFDYQTDYHNVTNLRSKTAIKLPHSNTLGFELLQTTALLKSAQVIEISGEGTMLRTLSDAGSVVNSIPAEVPEPASK